MDNEKAGYLKKLQDMILKCDKKGILVFAREAIDAGIDPIVAIGAMEEAIKEVGDGFGRRDLWLPELVGAGETMQRGVQLFEEEIEKSGVTRETIGHVVIGTVRGDLHNIGKNLVATLLRSEGFAVTDLGIDVGTEKFINAVKDKKPDILAMSALLTTTVSEQQRVIGALVDEGLKDTVKTIVGGAAITQEFADRIGADAYGSTASEGVRLARELVGLEKGGR